MAKVTINQGALDRVIQEALAVKQAEFNTALRRIIWDVRNEMVGQPSDDVYRELFVRLSSAFGESFSPDEDSLRTVAAAIEKDELTNEGA